MLMNLRFRPGANALVVLFMICLLPSVTANPPSKKATTTLHCHAGRDCVRACGCSGIPFDGH